MKFLATILTNKSVILTITVYILCGYICIIALSMGQQYSCLVLTEMEKDNSIFISYCSLCDERYYILGIIMLTNTALLHHHLQPAVLQYLAQSAVLQHPAESAVLLNHACKVDFMQSQYCMYSYKDSGN